MSPLEIVGLVALGVIVIVAAIVLFLYVDYLLSGF